VGTGAHGALSAMDDVRQQAADRDVELVILPTADAIEGKSTNAILHVTC
jgi:hypothetical protein